MCQVPGLALHRDEMPPGPYGERLLLWKPGFLKESLKEMFMQVPRG